MTSRALSPALMSVPHWPPAKAAIPPRNNATTSAFVGDRVPESDKMMNKIDTLVKEAEVRNPCLGINSLLTTCCTADQGDRYANKTPPVITRDPQS